MAFSKGEEITRSDRRLPVGAEFHDGITSFRVWAPRRRTVEVQCRGSLHLLEYEGNGYFSADIAIQAGSHYHFRLDGEDELYPDPASRFQPKGPQGPSEIIDPASFKWGDDRWGRSNPRCPIIYEMHIGTFTPEGTWQAAIGHLPALREIGITCLEVMPIAEFAGHFGWGYDGVDLFAPYHHYGRPDDVREFVQAAHLLGLAVILDVVYNHIGPDGNCLPAFSDHYFTDRYKCEWGNALNFDGEGSHGTREFISSNARYWVSEFHFDGLRLDATQQIFDASAVHILSEIGRAARGAAVNRKVYVVCENEPQDTRLVRSIEEGGYGLDAMWNDDFHHSAMVAATGQNRAYFSGYNGSAQEFVSVAKHKFLYQGQRYEWQGKRRGTSTFGVPYEGFINFLQNHDQIANTGFGKRLHDLTSFGVYKALTALMILMPGIPMLFQGQEFMASTPFLFFADHKQQLAEAVKTGRAEFLKQFPNLANPQVTSSLPDPKAHETFRACVLDHRERSLDRHKQILAMHRDLIELRNADAVLRAPDRSNIDGAVLNDRAFALRWCGEHHYNLLIVNLGADLILPTRAEPLLAPVGGDWLAVWSSEDVRYGGQGTPSVSTDENWIGSAGAAIVLRSYPLVQAR